MINPLHIINALKQPYIDIEHIDHIIVDTETINAGNRAVTARCHISGTEGDSLIKCYHRPKHNAQELYGAKYHPRAMRLYTISGHIEYADILIDRWVEGTPLDIRILDKGCDYKSLSRAFDLMALQLLDGDRAHGDIKPENIICKEDGTMQLIDWDAQWHEGMCRSDYDEYGTPEFNHPKRPSMRLSSHIDDFAIALISVILAASALDPEPFRGALDIGNRLCDPKLIICGKDPTLNLATQLLEAHDKAHYEIALRMANCRFGTIYGLHKLIHRALDIELVPNISQSTSYSDSDIDYRCKLLKRLNQRGDASTKQLWSFDEEDRLVMWLSDGYSIPTIAKLLNRSESAVRGRISKLRLGKMSRRR